MGILSRISEMKHEFKSRALKRDEEAMVKAEARLKEVRDERIRLEKRNQINTQLKEEERRVSEARGGLRSKLTKEKLAEKARPILNRVKARIAESKQRNKALYSGQSSPPPWAGGSNPFYPKVEPPAKKEGGKRITVIVR